MTAFIPLLLIAFGLMVGAMVEILKGGVRRVKYLTPEERKLLKGRTDT